MCTCRRQRDWTALWLTAAVTILMCTGSIRSQENRSAITIQVLDPQGAVIAGARAVLTDSAGNATASVTNKEGKVAFSSLTPGNSALRVTAEHFKPYENSGIQVVAAKDLTMNVTLSLESVTATISVFPDTSIARVAEYVGGSLVIRGDALASLEGPGGLEALLRVLALRTSGPFGPIPLVDGFADAQVPPTYSIREIRINDNPLSAEYSMLGLGRIEIFTKPGTDKLHASAYGTVGDDSWNSRNPFAPDKSRYNSRMYGGTMSGPVWPKKAAFFGDFNREQVETNAVINATVLDSSARIAPWQQVIVIPQTRTSFTPRLDMQMTTKHTWVLRYGDTRSRMDNSGVGEFSLLSRAQSSNNRVRSVQLTETAVLNPTSINETRASYVRTAAARYGNNRVPVVSVPGAFTGGGADISVAYDTQEVSEVQNTTSVQREKHALKFGLQARYTRQIDGSTQNFGGTYTFSSRIAPQLDSSGEVIRNAAGNPIMVAIDTIEAYRRTIAFGEQGLPPDAVRQLGGGASQFSITAGEIEARTRQYQAGAFIQHDWRLRPAFTLNSGIRLESQSNVARGLDIAPRLGFAWGIGAGQTAPPTVVRGGIGVFYDRIPDNVVLSARQMDGIRQHQYFTTDTSILDLFPAAATPNLLARFSVPQSNVRIARDLQSPYTVNTSLALERQLLKRFTIAVTAATLRSVHLLRSRNINAPLPGSYDPAVPQAASRPFPSADIFQYESSGTFVQRQLLVNFIHRAAKNVTLWSTYTLSSSKTDAESPDTFPASSYDLRAEYSRSSVRPEHTFYWGAWIKTRGGIEVTPLVLWRSKTPFNITTGSDTNGDSIFTDRPAFATELSRPSVKVTPFGAFDIDPLPGQRIIPRNYGESPVFFIANLRVGKRFPLTKRTAMTISVQGTNIFNHTNRGTPIGNLGSPLFGKSNTSAGDWGFGSNQAGNRRLETMLYISF